MDQHAAERGPLSDYVTPDSETNGNRSADLAHFFSERGERISAAIGGAIGSVIKTSKVMPVIIDVLELGDVR